MANYPHHQSFQLTNFTVFAEASFEFSPTINVLVGENGTGKTHLMKALYASQYTCSRLQGSRIDFEGAFLGVFQINSIDELSRTRYSVSSVTGEWNDKRWSLSFESYSHGSEGVGIQKYATPVDYPRMPRPVFIPAIDMMGHTRRFVSTFDEYNIDFDQTHRDIVALLLSPERRHKPQDQKIADTLVPLLGGELEEREERFYILTKQGQQPMPLVAEGLRKIATLYQLIRNGFLGPGSILFWDEPEVNVNPKLMDEIVGVLLKLARSGVQIFLATHSYVILKELDLQAVAEDQVRYFALESTKGGTVVHQTDDYANLEPNPIAEQFDSLYDRTLIRARKR